jgi:hypothetical protein
MRSLPVVPFALLLSLAPACGPVGGSGEGAGEAEPIGQSAAAITGATVIANGEEWVAAQLHYCQAAYGKVDDDSSCWAWEGSSHVCDRESNPAWNAYRSDCSGFVTFAWGLPAIGDGGYVTGDFAPFGTSFSAVIQASDLQPGDACNLTAGGHIVLFKAWTTVGSEAVFLEEPGCSANPPYAHEFTSSVSLSGSSIYIDYEGESFTAIRYSGLTGVTGSASCQAGGVSGTCVTASTCSGMSGYTASTGVCSGSDVCCKPPAAPSCEANGVKGTCIDTTTCGNMVDYVSTPGLCQGASNIQCCTLAPPPSCEVNGVKGTCIKTTACAGMSGYVSTPGYCPGPNQEECCTPTGADADAGSDAGGEVGAGTGGSAADGGLGGEHAVEKSSGCAMNGAGSTPAGGVGLLLGLALLRAARPRYRRRGRGSRSGR